MMWMIYRWQNAKFADRMFRRHRGARLIEFCAKCGIPMYVIDVNVFTAC